MRRGLELDHPLDGGSPNQSAQFQLGRRQPEVSPAPRGGQRASRQEVGETSSQAYSQARKESVQSPSRRVSNAVWPEERQTSSQSQSYTGHYEDSTPSPSPGAERQSQGRQEPAPAVYRREQTPDSLPPPQRGQQRNSYSGPPSGEYYRQDYR